MTQWLVEEAAFFALGYAEAQPVRSADPEEAAWERHQGFFERAKVTDGVR